jgi:tricorn protease
MKNRKIEFFLLIALLFLVSGWGAQGTGEPIKFARTAHIANDGRIAFTYHDDVWIADPDGANGYRLTAHIGNDFNPRFSPDGKWVAFTSNRCGNNDVFLIPATGGNPRQLTYYSGDDQALYWLSDGKALIITSNRGPNPFGSPLYRLPIDGGPPEPIAMGTARLGMMKQDGSAIAYNRALPRQEFGARLFAATPLQASP